MTAVLPRRGTFEIEGLINMETKIGSDVYSQGKPRTAGYNQKLKERYRMDSP